MVGGGPMREIKIPVQELRLKMLGGLIHEGGHVCGTLRYVLQHTRATSVRLL